eukprot:3533803-Rhodomonas_salina.2
MKGGRRASRRGDDGRGDTRGESKRGCEKKGEAKSRERRRVLAAAVEQRARMRGEGRSEAWKRSRVWGWRVKGCVSSAGFGSSALYAPQNSSPPCHRTHTHTHTHINSLALSPSLCCAVCNPPLSPALPSTLSACLPSSLPSFILQY